MPEGISGPSESRCNDQLCGAGDDQVPQMLACLLQRCLEPSPTVAVFTTDFLLLLSVFALLLLVCFLWKVLLVKLRPLYLLTYWYWDQRAEERLGDPPLKVGSRRLSGQR